MPQIQRGTVTVTNGQAKVVGDVNCDWTDASVNDWFSLVLVPPTPQIYQIAAIRAPNVSTSGFWELDVNGTISESELSSGAHAGEIYTIHIDFITVVVAGLTLQFPVFSPGDVQTSEILARFMAALAAALSAMQAGSTNLFHHEKVIAGADIGGDHIFMPFAATLSGGPPQFIGHPVIEKVSSGDDNVEVVSIDTVSADGYYVNLSAPAISAQKIRGSYIP